MKPIKCPRADNLYKQPYMLFDSLQDPMQFSPKTQCHKHTKEKGPGPEPCSPICKGRVLRSALKFRNTSQNLTENSLLRCWALRMLRWAMCVCVCV